MTLFHQVVAAVSQVYTLLNGTNPPHAVWPLQKNPRGTIKRGVREFNLKALKPKVHQLIG